MTNTYMLSCDQSPEEMIASVKNCLYAVNFVVFLFNDAATTEIYTLSLHDALPICGYGGVFTGEALDSFITTSALTSLTRRIILISTIHVLYGPWHPLHLAKYGATLDHISQDAADATGHTAHESSRS